MEGCAYLQPTSPNIDRYNYNEIVVQNPLLIRPYTLQWDCCTESLIDPYTLQCDCCTESLIDPYMLQWNYSCTESLTSPWGLQWNCMILVIFFWLSLSQVWSVCNTTSTISSARTEKTWIFKKFSLFQHSKFISLFPASGVKTPKQWSLKFMVIFSE